MAPSKQLPPVTTAGLNRTSRSASAPALRTPPPPTPLPKSPVPQLDPETRRHGKMTGIELIAEWNDALGLMASNSLLESRRRFANTLVKLGKETKETIEKTETAETREKRGDRFDEIKDISVDPTGSPLPAKVKGKGVLAKTSTLLGSLHRRSPSANVRSPSRKRSASRGRKDSLAGSEKPSTSKKRDNSRKKKDASPASQRNAPESQQSAPEALVDRSATHQAHASIADDEKALVQRVNTISRARIQFNIGILKGLNGEYFEAAAWFKQAIKTDPDMVIAWLARGIAKFEEGDWDASMRAFDAGRQITKDFIQKSNWAEATNSLGEQSDVLLPEGWWNVEVVRWDDVHSEEMYPHGDRRFGRKFFRIPRLVLEWNVKVTLLKAQKEWVTERIAALEKSLEDQKKIINPNQLLLEKKQETEAALAYLETQFQTLTRGDETSVWDCSYPICGIPVGTLLPPPAELIRMYSNHLPPARVPRKIQIPQLQMAQNQMPQAPIVETTERDLTEVEPYPEDINIDAELPILDHRFSQQSAIPKPLAIRGFKQTLTPSRRSSILADLDNDSLPEDSPAIESASPASSAARASPSPLSIPRGRTHRRTRSTLSEVTIWEDSTEPRNDAYTTPQPHQEPPPDTIQTTTLPFLTPFAHAPSPNPLSPNTPPSHSAPLARAPDADPLAAGARPRSRALTVSAVWPFARRTDWRKHVHTPTTEAEIEGIVQLYFRPDMEEIEEGGGQDGQERTPVGMEDAAEVFEGKGCGGLFVKGIRDALRVEPEEEEEQGEVLMPVKFVPGEGV